MKTEERKVSEVRHESKQVIKNGWRCKRQEEERFEISLSKSDKEIELMRRSLSAYLGGALTAPFD